jgi:hypothetical protein
MAGRPGARNPSSGVSPGAWLHASDRHHSPGPRIWVGRPADEAVARREVAGRPVSTRPTPLFRRKNGFDPAPSAPKWVRSGARRPKMGSFSARDGFDPGAVIGFDPAPGAARWVCSGPEMGSIAAPRLGSIRIPDGFDPPDGSVPSRVSERAAWGRVALGSSQDPPCHEGTLIRDGPSGPDQGNPAATVPRYYREMRGRLGTLPGAIPPAELSLVGWVRAQRINVNIFRHIARAGSRPSLLD